MSSVFCVFLHFQAFVTCLTFHEMCQLLLTDTTTLGWKDSEKRELWNVLNRLTLTSGLKMVSATSLEVDQYSVSSLPYIITATQLFHPTLRTVNIMCSITDDVLLALIDNSPNIEKLHLHDAGSITNTGLEALAKKCQLLEDIFIQNINHLSDRAVEALALGCTLLKTMCICDSCLQPPRLTGMSLVALATNACNLRDVQFFCNFTQNDDGVKALRQMRKKKVLVIL